MAYVFEKNFFYRNEHDEDLDHVPEFKEKIDGLVKNAKTVLAVGWRPDTGYCLYEYLTSFAKVTLVEIFPANCSAFSLPGVNVVCSNILDYIKTTTEHFDVCIWQDGPEHIYLVEFDQFLIDSKGKIDSIIIATPNGFLPQSAIYGNVFEQHISTWFKKDYTDRGFNVTEYLADIHGSMNRRNGLIGYKTL